MSGHSKWHSIREKKGVADQKRGKIFTKHARLVELAARSGGDPGMNPSLRMAIDNAKADNVPNENIDRAIKKGTGESNDGKIFEDVVYEGFGPDGTAFMVEVYTDNRNRANQSVKTAMQRNGGNMGSSGATAFMFDRKGEIELVGRGNADDDELEIIDSGADDLERIEDGFVIYTDAGELGAVRDKLIEVGFSVKSAQLTYVAKDVANVAEKELATKLMKLVDALEDEDEVTNVCVNFEIDDAVL